MASFSVSNHYIGLSDYYQTQIWGNRKICSFDDDLASKAEQSSSKWTHLFKCSSPDEDVHNVTKIIRTTGLNSTEERTFNAQQTEEVSKYESLTEENKLILFGKQYFGFEASAQPIAVPFRDVKTELNSFSTIFDQDQVIDDSAFDETTLLEDIVEKPSNAPRPIDASSKSEHKMKKIKKKGRTKYRPFETGILTSTDEREKPFVGAPPGVRVTKSQKTRCFDLSKSGTSSLQFRL